MEIVNALYMVAGGFFGATLHLLWVELYPYVASWWILRGDVDYGKLPPAKPMRAAELGREYSRLTAYKRFRKAKSKELN